jgi:virginiamycin B lyase
MKTTRRLVVGFVCLVGASAAAPPARGIGQTLMRGVVRGASGTAVAGAMVSATHRAHKRATTVFTDQQGAFRMPPLEPGEYDLRVRRIGYQDLDEGGVDLRSGTRHLDFELRGEADPRAVAWQLPSSRWMPLLLARLSSDEHREEFTRQCTFCHQQGSWATRVPRSNEEWEKIFKLMARMGGVISSDLRAELPRAFNEAYADDAVLAALTGDGFVPPPGPDEEARRAVITEWDLGHPASMQHDIVVHPDGTIYSADTNQDRLYRLDPRTNERRSWAIPRGDSPLGGVFAGSGTILAPNSNAHVAPHSLQVAPDGTIWMTLCLGNKVARFDPSTQEWRIVEQKDGLYPHTLRFDQQGRVWYTLAVSNHVAMIDPRSGKQRVIRLPARDWKQEVTRRLVPVFLKIAGLLSIDEPPAGEGVNLPVPYGIDIAPDGAVWFSQLNERRIGRIDPRSEKIEMIDTPFPGPRRLRFDSKGNLWIPGFSAGLVARYTPRTREFRTWKLPIEGVETPYALNVDRRSDTVWICGTNSDSLIRFQPATEKFTVFPLPTRVTYTREIDFDDGGNVWTSNSNFPSWQIEGSGPKVIRLEVNGAAARAERDLAADDRMGDEATSVMAAFAAEK